MALAVVRDLRERRAPLGPEELADFETEVLAGFVLARASAGLADSTIRNDVGQLEQVRAWFKRPLCDMEPADADVYFGKVLRGAAKGTRHARAQALTTYFRFLELRHKVEIHQMTGRVVECPIDEMNRPRGEKTAALRIPPTAAEIAGLFAGWRGDLASCRKFAPTARNYAAARLMSEVGLRINEVRSPDFNDVKWDLGSSASTTSVSASAAGTAARERMVPLINDAGRTLRWFIEDVWGQLDDDPDRPGAPMFPSERKASDGSGKRASDDVFCRALAQAVDAHLPSWAGKLTPHILRHYCASELYAGGMDFLAIQDLLGHSWVATTMKYVNPRELHQMREKSQVAC